jgi:hypothetical protein
MRLLPILILAACNGGDSGDKAGSSTIVLVDDNNYSYDGQLNFPTYTTGEHIYLNLGFGQLTKDMLCHDLDPTVDVVTAGLSLFPRLSCDEVAKGFTDDSLLSSDLAGYVSTPTYGETSVELESMTFNGTEFDLIELYEHIEGGCWVFNLSAGEDYTANTLFAVNLDPQPTSDVDTVELQDDCDVVDFSWDLHSLTKPVVDSTATSWTVDWDSVLYTGHGDFFKPSDVDTIMVARYDTLTPTDLEAQFLDLELISDGLWTEFTDGSGTASLGGLVDASGSPFPGFTPGPTWILALRCDTCKNPAPLFLTVLDVQ